MRVIRVHTEESEPVAEQHGGAQVVYQVQIREGPSDAIVLQKPGAHTNTHVNKHILVK